MPSLFPSPFPNFPDFNSLLVLGPYHASASIYLSLSLLSDQWGQPIILSPSRSTLLQALRAFNDSWLATNSGAGKISEKLAKISMFYPPSPTHLCLFLSMLHANPTKESDTGASFLHPKTTCALPPSLLVLLEPSSYFLSSSSSESPYTLSSYLNLVARVFASIAGLKRDSTQPIAFALFDSRLEGMKMPVVKQPTNRYSLNKPDGHPHPRPEFVLPFVERYFEWVAAFDEETEYVPSSQEDSPTEGDHKKYKHLNLSRIHQDTEVEPSVVKWMEISMKSSNTVSNHLETHLVLIPT